MSEPSKRIFQFLVFAILAILLAGWAISLVVGILKTLIPIAFVALLGYGVYKMFFAPKSLSGGRRKYLP
jgi:hypothetical protein